MRYLIGVFVLSALLFSCSNPDSIAEEKAKQDSLTKVAARGKYQAAVDSAEKAIRNDKNYDKRLAEAAIKAYSDFTVTFPDDSMTPEYLFRASDLAQGNKQYQQAAVYLETIIEKHKEYRKYETACFMAAFIYDTYLENINHGGDRAKTLYEFVISHYPNTKQAEDSKVLVKYIGMPDSVMINDIIKKGGK